MARPIQIIPSVLPADWANMGAECKRLEDAGVDRIQFDVMDGNFVPNLTFGPDVIAAQRKTTKLMFETQLMVSERCTDAMLPQFTEATKGPNGEPGVVIVHVEACTHLHRALSNIRAMGGSPSVALNPSTPAEAIENVLDLVDHVLVMTVNPGFGGQAYIPTMTDKIRKIRKIRARPCELARRTLARAPLPAGGSHGPRRASAPLRAATISAERPVSASTLLYCHSQMRLC